MMMMGRLSELRKARGITQQRVAVDLGMEQTSISAYEAGKYLPTVDALVKLADYFNVSTDYLLGLTDAKPRLAGQMDDVTGYAASLFASLPGVYRERAIGYLEALRDAAK